VNKEATFCSFASLAAAAAAVAAAATGCDTMLNTLGGKQANTHETDQQYVPHNITL
jgi:hypothetical protein